MDPKRSVSLVIQALDTLKHYMNVIVDGGQESWWEPLRKRAGIVVKKLKGWGAVQKEL